MLRIDSGCIGCGACVDSCPAYIITLEDGKAASAGGRCIQCGQCEAVCPADAIFNPEIPHEDILVFTEEHSLSPAQAEQFLRSRRSIRHWQDRSVPREATEQLLRMGRFAQTGSNTQGVSYVIISTKEKMEQVRQLTMEFFRDSQDPRLQALYRRMCNPVREGEDLLFRNAPMLIVLCGDRTNMAVPGYVYNPLFSLMYIELFAPVLGLGTCAAGYFNNYLRTDCDRLRELLELDDKQVPYTGLMYGYPKHSYRRAPDRRPLRMSFLDQ